MASIGQFSFSQWRIAMPRQRRPKIRLPARSGVNGNVLVRGYYRMDPATGWTATIAASLSAAQSLIDSYTALASSTGVVTVVDQFGRSYSGVIVLDVRHELSLQIGNLARVDAYWTLDVGFPS